MIYKDILYHKLLKTILLTGVLTCCFAITALAQNKTNRQESDVITVTGSRIPRTDLEGTSPVAVFQIEDLQQSGATSIGQLLREMPSIAGNAMTVAVNNGGTGSQNISLRGLGSTRTLVLINGKRSVGSGQAASTDGVNGTVDLNIIPISMVERIEVLKDGASAIYGSDAVAGVVNLILKKDFNGLGTNLQYGISSKGDGRQQQYDVTFGNSGDVSHFLFGLSWTKYDPILANDRDFSKTALSIVNGELIPSGSSASPWGNYSLASGRVTRGPEYGNFRPYTGASDTYNYSPINYTHGKNQRYSLNFSAAHKLDFLNIGYFDDLEAYAQASYTNRKSVTQIAYLPLAPFAFFGYENANYSANNAYNPFGEDISDWRRRIVESGPRTEEVRQNTVRFVTGIKGMLANNWNWDLYYIYGDNSASFKFGPVANLERVGNAVGPTTGSIAGGDLACQADPDNCVPLNVFGKESITQEMLDYFMFFTNETGGQTQQVLAYEISKPDLFKLPAGHLGFAAGISYRKEKGFDGPDSLVNSLGEGATGTPREPTSGGYDVTEVYSEFLVPILKDLPFIEHLELSTAIRYSDYDTFGDTTNWKLGLLYRPISQLLLRGTASTAFRAPTIADLYGGSGFSFPETSDPCATNPTQFCINDGVPAQGYIPVSDQIRSQVGGSRALQAETADIYTLGFVFTSKMLEGVALSVDYYDIKVDDPITSIGTEIILSECAKSGQFCNLIDRFTTGANTGAPLLVRNSKLNAGRIKTNGVDASIEWKGLENRLGVWNLKLDLSYVDKYDLTLPNGKLVPHAGYLRDDLDGYFGKWRWIAGIDWKRGPFTVSADIRYIDGAREFADSGCIDENGAVIFPGLNANLSCVSNTASPELGKYTHKIRSRTYLDLQFSYNFPFLNGNHQLYFGIDNVFDKQPPLSIDGFNDNTDVRTFDTIGRFFYAGFRAKF